MPFYSLSTNLTFLLQRSFRKELFEDAAVRMERARIKTPDEIKRFLALAERAHEIAVQNMKREVDFNDAPEEFKGTISFCFDLPFFVSHDIVSKIYFVCHLCTLHILTTLKFFFDRSLNGHFNGRPSSTAFWQSNGSSSHHATFVELFDRSI